MLNSVTYIDYYMGKIIPTSRRGFPLYEASPNSKKILVYACFCSTPQELAARFVDVTPLVSEFDEVVLVNSGNAVANFPVPENVKFVTRENQSRDLGSYRDAITSLNLSTIKELVLINDSVVWLPNSLLNFVTKSRSTEFSITGISESMQLGRHIQSYAIHFKDPSEEAIYPILRVRNWKLKRTLVKHGERYFSKHWKKRGLSFAPLYSNDLLRATCVTYIKKYGRDEKVILELMSKSVELNPSIHLWPGLLFHARIVKKSLLRNNPAKFDNPPRSVNDILKILEDFPDQQSRSD